LIIPNLANVMLTLRNDSDVRNILAYDQMFCGEMLMQNICNKPLLTEPRPVTDVDVTALQEWFQLKYVPSLGSEVLHKAIDLRARERSFHPVRIYLNGCVWDGTLRVERMLPVYFGTADIEYTREVGTMFMVAAVKRIYEPGCQADYMLVLEGEEQGEFKSSACKVLGGEWFSDHLPDLATSGKDVSQHIRGKWIIEVGEMDAMTKAEDTRLKSFLSRTIEQYRPSYGKRQVHEKRQCLFIGTTNKTEYLRDETGGRRYWPARTGKIDLDGIKRDRDQLFAEAKFLYESGRPSWPDRVFEQRFMKPEQEARFEADPWEDSIIPYLDDLAVGTKVTITQVVEWGLLLNPENKTRIGMGDARRIRAILKRKKDWVQHRMGTGRFWIKLK
jgi:predicted P-loop ATPase